MAMSDTTQQTKESIAVKLERRRHSLALIVTCLFGFVVFSPETFSAVPWLIALSKFAMAGGLAALGIAAHAQAVANAVAIQSVDDKVVKTGIVIDGRMSELIAASKSVGAQEQREETREDVARAAVAAERKAE
jgi:uncharacterized membrane protein